MSLQSREWQKPIKLDLYDKKLLFYLLQDSRTPHNLLAKRLGISLQRTQYKIRRLEQELISPSAIINFPLLRIPSHYILVQHLSNAHVQRLLDTSSLFFLMQTIGKYNYALLPVTDDVQLFCQEYLPDTHFEIHPIIRYIPDNYNPFKLNLPVEEDVVAQQYDLDNKDYVILAHLCTHPHDPLLVMSIALHIDRQTIKQRIRRMQAAGIVQKFRYGINIFRLGMLVYLIKVDLPVHKKNQLLTYLRNDSYSGFIFETHTGYVMFYMPPSHNEIYQFTEGISRIESAASIDVIQNTDVFKVEPTPKSATTILKKLADAR